MKHQDKQTEAIEAAGAIVILLFSIAIVLLGRYLIILEVGV